MGGPAQGQAVPCRARRDPQAPDQPRKQLFQLQLGQDLSLQRGPEGIGLYSRHRRRGRLRGQDRYSRAGRLGRDTEGLSGAARRLRSHRALRRRAAGGGRFREIAGPTGGVERRGHPRLQTALRRGRRQVELGPDAQRRRPAQALRWQTGVPDLPRFMVAPRQSAVLSADAGRSRRRPGLVAHRRRRPGALRPQKPRQRASGRCSRRDSGCPDPKDFVNAEPGRTYQA